MCSACSKAGDGDWEGLDELAANSSRSTYLCGCPCCGSLWMGHGYTPQLMLELTVEEAQEAFPDWQGPNPTP